MTAERVLDQPGGNIALDLFVLHQHLGALLDAAFEGSGVTAAEYAVYSQLAQRPRTPRVLCGILGLRPATLSGYLVTLDRREHIERIPHETDGRSHRVALTPKGREQTEACRLRMRRAVRTLNRNLVGDVDEARRTLADIDQAIAVATSSISTLNRR